MTSSYPRLVNPTSVINSFSLIKCLYFTYWVLHSIYPLAYLQGIPKSKRSTRVELIQISVDSGLMQRDSCLNTELNSAAKATSSGRDVQSIICINQYKHFVYSLQGQYSIYSTVIVVLARYFGIIY